jgi:hypothetical protein
MSSQSFGPIMGVAMVGLWMPVPQHRALFFRQTEDL